MNPELFIRMRTVTFFSRSLLTCLAVLLATHTHAQEVRAGMNALLPPFKAIQPYIASEQQFLDPNNRADVTRIIQDLRAHFHKVEAIPSRYHSLPGFNENIRNVAELLDDSSRRFSEGKASYAWWRLRKLPTDCFTCHATYKVASHYSNAGAIDESLDPLNRARFLLATRQFSEARDAFAAVLKSPEYTLYYNEALRSLVLITTRIDRNPAEGAEQLRAIARTAALPEEDAREAQQWADELTAWSRENPTKTSGSLQRAEQLIDRGSKISPDTPHNDVALLRGTAMLHQQLEDGKLPKEQRPRALYLLGFAYTKLPLFFSESWAEMYLERCIREYPGTAIAQKSYRTYREHIVDDYTGTAGTDIPAEIKLYLEELHNKAYGIGSFGPIAIQHTR
jgi:hypothetical protein